MAHIGSRAKFTLSNPHGFEVKASPRTLGPKTLHPEPYTPNQSRPQEANWLSFRNGGMDFHTSPSISLPSQTLHPGT